MWGDSQSAFKNTSIEHNDNFRGPFIKNLEIRMLSDLAHSVEVADFHKFPEKKRLSPVYMSIRLYTEIREFQDLTVERP